MRIVQGGAVEEITYQETAYIPVRNLFGPRVSEIRWDNKNKTEWQEKLRFLGIKGTSALPGVKDGYLHVYVTFEEYASQA